MEKVTLPKEVCEAIEQLRDELVTDFGIVDFSYLQEQYPEQARVISNYCSPFYGNSLDVYLKAILYGYTYKKEPEEKLLERFLNIRESLNKRNDIFGELQLIAELDGIRETVRLLSEKYPELEELLKKID